jgi:type IV secretory pathway VirB2 component (pilin)
MGDFVRSIGEGVGGLVGGSIDALSNAFDTVVGDLQQMLPGPLFPIAVIAVVVLLFWWLFKK